MNKTGGMKQAVLKAQDLLVIAKVAIAPDRATLTFAGLSAQLLMSASEVHAAVQRSTASHLLTRDFGELSANRTALMELLIHGVPYVFPAVFGPVARGIPTSVSAAPLNQHFEHGDALPVVWPHSTGELRGLSLCPLYPAVPSACLLDPQLHQVLALVDALRAGSSRERELAIELLPRYFQ